VDTLVYIERAAQFDIMSEEGRKQQSSLITATPEQTSFTQKPQLF